MKENKNKSRENSNVSNNSSNVIGWCVWDPLKRTKVKTTKVKTQKRNILH